MLFALIQLQEHLTRVFLNDVKSKVNVQLLFLQLNKD